MLMVRAGEVAHGGLRATRLPWDYAEDHGPTALADPDGNELCAVQSPFTQV
jgi:hypothetical protein